MRRPWGRADRAKIRRSLLVLTLVWAGLAAVAGGSAWVEGAGARLIAAEGQSAEAVVTGRRIAETRRGAQVDEDYFVTLRFADAGGQVREVEVEVTRDRHAALPEGSRLMLRHAPSDPGVVEIAPGELAAASGRAGLAAAVLGAVAALFGAGWAWMGRGGGGGGRRR